MKENRMKIVLEVPIAFAFKFSLNPENTPKWIDSITKEVSNENPPKIGTIYKNWDREGVATEYEITEFNINNFFTLSEKSGDYHVQYVFKSISNNQTEFEYYEWVDRGELSQPFKRSNLEIFKLIVEQEL